MAKITEVKASVTRLIAGPTKVLKKYENVTIHAEAVASVAETEDPHVVFKDTLWFCQQQIIKEMERMEQGKPPGPAELDDEIPDFEHPQDGLNTEDYKSR